MYCIMSQEKQYLREGTLLEGTVAKILPYGAQVKLGDSSRRLVRSIASMHSFFVLATSNYVFISFANECLYSGLLHISNITRRRIGSVNDVLQVDESVKVLVVKSLFPDKISLR